MKKILILSFAILLLFSCSNDKKKTESNETVVAVRIQSVSLDKIRPFVSASGKIESENSADISTRMMGYVSKVHVKVGQKVSRGQLLVSISNADLQAKKAQANAAVLQAAAAFKNAEKDYTRFVNLFSQQSASQKELDDITARYEMAKANLQGAEQMKNEVIAQFAYTNITAPFSGIVTQTFVKDGDMANPGMPLISVEGTSKRQVTAMVSEADISNIKEGMEAIVLIKSSNKKVSGKVSEISLSAKNTGGQYLVKIVLDTIDAETLAGMFVNVQFPFEYKPETKPTDKILVAESALVRQGQLTGIYTIGDNNVALLRWLRVGNIYGNQVEVLSGLSADEKYIVSSDGKLFNGVRVRIQ